MRIGQILFIFFFSKKHEITIDHILLIFKCLTLLWCFLNKQRFVATCYHSSRNSTTIFGFDRLPLGSRLCRVPVNHCANRICDKKMISEIKNIAHQNYNFLWYNYVNTMQQKTPCKFFKIKKYTIDNNILEATLSVIFFK